MSGNDKKRKAEESILEKIYAKLKKVDDNYYNLKKSIKASQSRQDGRVDTTKSTKNDGANDDKRPARLNKIMLALGLTECPNDESDNLKKSIIDSDKIQPLDGETSEHETVKIDPINVNANIVTDDSPLEVSIDEDVLEVFGDDPSSLEPKNFQFHSILASRWKVWLAAGLDKETRVNLLKEHPREGNCFLDAPILNPELVASLNETAVKRDKHFIDSQCLIGSAMSALGSAITLLLNEKTNGVDKNELLKLMCDSGKLMADLHHKESIARKAYILPGLDKKAKVILGKVETDKYLFGENLSEKLKSAKAVEKAGLELKIQPTKSTSKTPFKSNNSVNWKSPAVKYQKTQQSGNNQKSSFQYKSKKGQQDQENFKKQSSDHQYKQKGSDNSSKEKK